MEFNNQPGLPCVGGWPRSNYLESSGGGASAGTRTLELRTVLGRTECPNRSVLGTLEEEEFGHRVGVIPT